ncbi:EAL domain-containing protein [Marinobacter sp. M3C]|jgi:EAL domain-containing protein (putative c-di-GMP-specific phosphodiesterase class I)/GGDEF domain-containing protein|uniref:EAL domain-containing protein n=1 Tax=unclassified Marinobacter TaxID=83889 RepID=UPI00200F0FFA|nr:MULTISPECIES: EAL domain-containing protein [unclassified Marinobacter]MCL1479058.1 EAL domain-containing protein [Marinobacter sp.]UQG57136.1 EAL domain-containing protein [Marinobacter sp. M4C]UQG61682.1 EAL domain-containing protein [Marinobacter sp. M3C]UQG65940.1 EAL domain-containing protein [Marinobacter sp. M2C]UQG70220.1 EAL domain-containing protein [Marinobacter sp. M1C]
MMLIKGGKKSVDTGRPVSTKVPRAPMFYSQVFYELPIPGFIVDVEAGSKIVDANWAAVDAFDTTPSKIIGSAFPELFVVNSPDSCLDHDQLPSIGSEFTCHFMASGLQSSIEISGVSRFDIDGKTFATILFRLKKLSDWVQADLQERMFLDIQSGLPNGFAAKRKLEMFGQTGLRQSRIYAVAIFSLENWQQTKVLPEVRVAAIILKLALRIKLWEERGVFLSRHEKNGFLIILQDRADYKKILENIFGDLSEPVVLEGNTYTFPVNAGVYVWSVWEPPVALEMLTKAREAHYQSLLIGLNRWCFYSEGKNRKDWQEVEGRRITDAFRRGDFCLYFQPLMQFNSAVPHSAEALLRWNDPGKGIKEPVEFLAKLKSLPIYDDISLWVLDLALITLERWYKSGHYTKLCINIEAEQLAKPEFVERMLIVMNGFSSRAFSFLSIDIVNSSKLADFGALVSSLRALGVYGVDFSVDDFVFSDAQLLEAKPVSVRSLKIARHCLKNLEHNLTDMRLVRNVVCLAARHGVTVYAKGVERSAQHNVLKALGCDGVQGHLQSGPLVEAGFLSYLATCGQPENAAEDAEYLKGFSEALSNARRMLQDKIWACLNTCNIHLISESVLQSLLITMSDIEARDCLTDEGISKVKAAEQAARHTLKLTRKATTLSSTDDGEKRDRLLLRILVSLSDLVVALDNIIE